FFTIHASVPRRHRELPPMQIAVNRAVGSRLYPALPTGGTMIRALALLSLTMFAACAASHAAAPGPPQGTWVAGQPEDPYTSVAIGGRESQFCAPGATCAWECPEGGCAYTCAEGSTCSVECDGGRCKTSCGINASCNIE